MLTGSEVNERYINILFTNMSCITKVTKVHVNTSKLITKEKGN